MEHVISNANAVFGLDHVTNIMKFHSTYLETFLSLQECIIYGEGPLPIQYRHYIAIMVNKLNVFIIKNVIFKTSVTLIYIRKGRVKY